MEGTGGDFDPVFRWVEEGLTGDFPDCLAPTRGVSVSVFVVLLPQFCLVLAVFFKDWKLSLSESTKQNRDVSHYMSEKIFSLSQ